MNDFPVNPLYFPYILFALIAIFILLAAYISFQDKSKKKK
jgi:hypothetical protein